MEKANQILTIRFAGDSGDGMQLTGERFTNTSAVMGNEVATFSDFPAEIRAPAGSLGGVSGFQLTFGTQGVFSVHSQADALVAMNPAALKVNLPFVKKNGVLIINKDAFTTANLNKAEYEGNPLEDGSLSNYQLFDVGIAGLTKEALKDTGLSPKDISRCKNFFALGLSFWLFERELNSTEGWLDRKFAKKPELAEANKKALKSGWNFGESTEAMAKTFALQGKKHLWENGTYRNISGNKAVALGLVAAAKLADKNLFLGSYPITPATDILHELAGLKAYGVVTYQAEDEIAAIGAALGASYAGSLAVTTTSGPGLALKGEFLGLAVITELPLVIVDVQRGGPSTGLPTKNEQSDLLQAMYGRNGDCPLVVMAASSPSDCFNTTIEACRIAVKYMTPVILLSDNTVANGAEVWKVPQLSDYKKIEVSHKVTDFKNFKPYERNPQTLARPWVPPGTKGGEHRIGGLEKADLTGNISYDPINHEKMTNFRAQKIANVANDIPATEIIGDPKAKVLVVGWGSSYGVIRETVESLYERGLSVACIHLKFINPMPRDVSGIIQRHDKVVVAEYNNGQLWTVLSSQVDKKLFKLNKVQGSTFSNSEIEDKVIQLLEEK